MNIFKFIKHAKLRGIEGSHTYTIEIFVFENYNHNLFQ